MAFDFEFMNPMFAMFNGWEIVAILAIVLVLFGAKKLPELARGLGQGIKEFKKSSREIQDELDHAMDMNAPAETNNKERMAKLPNSTQATIEAPATTAEKSAPPPSV
jgi:sec-independent protein translocase protein TatA